MRTLGWLLLVGSALAPLPHVASAGQAGAPPAVSTPPAPPSPAPAPATEPTPAKPVGTVSELMVQIIYPNSDAVFYISTRTPDSDRAWIELQAKMLALAESANLLMMPGRARDQDRWMKDSKLLLDAGTAAFRAAKRKDVDALGSLSEPLLTSCITCHQDYRPTYRRRLP